MRYALPMAATLLVGVAAVVHPAFVGPAGPDRRHGPQPEAPQLISPPEQPVERIARVPETPALPLKGEASGAVAAGPRSPETSWRKISFQLIRDLSLTTQQQTMIEEILRDREDEIGRYHHHLRTIGVVDIRQFEWQTNLMKESWYRKIAAVLNRAQIGQLVLLVEKGLLNEGLSFAVDPGMTVID